MKNRLHVIPVDKSEAFVKKFNSNTHSDEFIGTCKLTKKLFKRKKKSTL